MAEKKTTAPAAKKTPAKKAAAKTSAAKKVPAKATAPTKAPAAAAKNAPAAKQAAAEAGAAAAKASAETRAATSTDPGDALKQRFREALEHKQGHNVDTNRGHESGHGPALRSNDKRQRTFRRKSGG